MTGDHFLQSGDADYHALQKEYSAKGFTGESHDMVVLRCGQAWRLIQGAEPWHFAGLPAHMRYAPYALSPLH